MEPTARTLDQSGPRSKSPQPKSNPQVLHAKARTTKEGGRQRFTAAEDKALIEAVDDARRLGENIGGKLFYEEFAKDNPTHTAESWRSRYHRTLAPRLFPNGLPVSDDQPEAIRRVVTKTRHTTETEDSPHGQPDSPRGQRSQAAREEDPTENADDLVDPATLEAQEAQPRESRTPSPQPPKSAVNGESMEGYHGESHIPSTPTHDRQTTTTSNEAHSYREFYDYLEDYVIKFPNTIDTKPRIRGVKIDLFRLQKAVESQEVDFDELDWSLVCEDIGFESPDSDLVKSVEECYGANLQGFVEVLRGFNECGSEVVSPESDSGSRLSVDQDERPESDTMLNRVSLPGREGHRGSDNDELADVQSGSASSPTPRHLGKRQRTRELFNERHKRRRLARDIEIPDTPEATSKFRLQSPFDEPDNEGNEEEGEGDEDVEDTEDPSGNSPSQQLRSELAQSVSSRNSEQSSSQDHPTAAANGRIKAPIAEIGESLRYAAHEKLPKQGRLPDGPAATRNINKNVDAKSASSRTVSRVSTHQTQGANPAPRSAQPPPITVRSTPTKKALQPNKEVSVRPHVFSTPRPSASKPMGVDSPLASIPHDILSDITSSPGTRRQTASFVTPSASSRRAPESSRRPPAQQNSPKILHQHPQKILPSIEGGHNSIASTSRCSEEVKRLAALGYRQEFIDKLLHATSRDVTVMKKVCELKAQKKSKGYGAASGPSESMPNMRGVWTADEDRKLVKIYEFDQMDDADKTAAAQRTRDQDERVLKQKHGWEGALEARRRFLQRQSEFMG
ncbi:hypothetical protein MCOR25_004966 [Pyricularia grisea]|nr:hypothetical protein MCOR25_004966 [Pyricularia grisea]